MSFSPLALKLLNWIADTSRRTDVHVKEQTTSWGGSIGKWKSVLPPDMFEFYDTLNGLCFFYELDGEGWNGFNLLGLEQGTRKVIDTRHHRFSIPHQKASRYSEYFFDDSSDVKSDDEVLLFMGSDDAWGVLMVGCREEASFYKWNNDGFTEYLGRSFTDVIEQGLAHGFAHTWAYKQHPDTDNVVTRLATKVPEHHTFDVHVQEVEELDGAGWRRHLASQMPASVFDKLMKVIGRDEVYKKTTPEERANLVATALGPDARLDAKQIKLIMPLFNKSKKTKKAFAEFAHHDNVSCWRVFIEVTHVGGPLPLVADSETALRVCASIPELAPVFSCSNVPMEVYACARPLLFGYRPHLSFFELKVSSWSPGEWRQDVRKKEQTSTLSVVVAQDLSEIQAKKTYTSTALPAVQSKIIV